MRCWAAVAALLAVTAAPIAQASEWAAVNPSALVDDDIARHAGDASFLEGIAVSEIRLSENGFDWQLIRFASSQKWTALCGWFRTTMKMPLSRR